MANTSKEKTVEEKTLKKEPKYTLAKMKENCNELFGCSYATFSGALSGTPDGEYTISEIKSKIDKWLKKEAK